MHFYNLHILFLASNENRNNASRHFKSQEEEFYDARREKREQIGCIGIQSLWGFSPARIE